MNRPPNRPFGLHPGLYRCPSFRVPAPVSLPLPLPLPVLRRHPERSEGPLYWPLPLPLPVLLAVIPQGSAYGPCRCQSHAVILNEVKDPCITFASECSLRLSFRREAEESASPATAILPAFHNPPRRGGPIFGAFAPKVGRKPYPRQAVAFAVACFTPSS